MAMSTIRWCGFESRRTGMYAWSNGSRVGLLLRQT